MDRLLPVLGRRRLLAELLDGGEVDRLLVGGQVRRADGLAELADPLAVPLGLGRVAVLLGHLRPASGTAPARVPAGRGPRSGRAAPRAATCRRSPAAAARPPRRRRRGSPAAGRRPRRSRTPPRSVRPAARSGSSSTTGSPGVCRSCRSTARRASTRRPGSGSCTSPTRRFSSGCVRRASCQASNRTDSRNRSPGRPGRRVEQCAEPLDGRVQVAGVRVGHRLVVVGRRLQLRPLALDEVEQVGRLPELRGRRRARQEQVRGLAHHQGRVEQGPRVGVQSVDPQSAVQADHPVPGQWVVRVRAAGPG